VAQVHLDEVAPSSTMIVSVFSNSLCRRSFHERQIGDGIIQTDNTHPCDQLGNNLAVFSKTLAAGLPLLLPNLSFFLFSSKGNFGTQKRGLVPSSGMIASVCSSCSCRQPYGY